MQIATTLRHSATCIVVLFFICLPIRSSADEIVVTSHPSLLRLSPGRPVDNSPGTRTGAVVTCNRVHLRGLSRIRDLDKFFHALRLTASVSQGDGLFRIQTVELCFHRNASLGIGMCPAGHWRKVTNKGSFVRSVSPFEDWILDVRVLPDPSRVVEVTKFLPHRVVFLVLGFSIMLMADSLSESITFYYGSAMTIGIILVILMVLYQGMKLLPTGRKSSLAVVMYSSIVGVAASLLHHFSVLLRAALVEIGIYEDMHKPLGILLLVCLILAGAWFGYWGVRKLVLTEEGLVDTDVAYFVKWAALIFAGIMILQSSLDASLAVQALVISIITSVVSRTYRKLKFSNRLLRMIFKFVYTIFTTIQFPNPTKYKRWFQEFNSATPTQNNSTNIGMSRPNITFEGDNYYSTFHRTPERKTFNKDEWETFTRAETRKALRELVSSPDFSRWAAHNAERITLTPPPDARRIKKRRLFGWWS
ncbi:hypothetical protein M5K25_004359 [Dendrobium thyrsiflorum]|uniref:Nuclear envelope integral membrane protein 1 n=1 Tax=Dendrobium thyrsiflorum TaxID=117978 RepID=A0ABD0VM36_DENTH